MRGPRHAVGRVGSALLLAGALGAGTLALTAANTVPATRAGDGTGAVTGYVVSTIHYNLNATNPANIDSLTFTLDAAPAAGSTIRAQLAPAGAWYTCTNAGTAVTCTTTAPQATVLATTALRVIAAD
jgi:hypothetical protein